MGNFIIMGIILFLLLVFALIFAYLTLKGKRPETDYYSMFVMGIIFLPVGIALDMQVFFILGLVFMGVGLSHKDKWKKNHRTWSKLSEEEKKVKGIIIAVLAGLLLLGAITYYFYA
ncbi:hypothetical protein GOV05_02985 [Candidatus Woesearchaeota archaeon]|nr:hypothetical protein [Candidatus Woesearchaeota archaeon]